MVTKHKPTTDALGIIHRRYFEGKPEMLRLLEQERENARIARTIYQLRTAAGLSQRELAKRVDTSASAICRLEDADYEGHSLSMLQRIAAALGHRVEVHFVPARAKRGKKKNAKAATRKKAGKEIA